MITRPEPGLSETMFKVQKLGWKTLSLPLMGIRLLPVEFAEIDKVQAVLFTSRQAVASTIKLFIQQDVAYKDIPVFAVGDVTANDAVIAGFKQIKSAHKDADALNQLIQKELLPERGSLLFPVGKRQGRQLIYNLRQAGFNLMVKEVYETYPVDHIALSFIEILKQQEIHTILFFSSETVRFFINSLPEDLKYFLKHTDAIAISNKVGKALEQLPWKQIHVADRPCTEAMLSLLTREHS